MSDQDNARPRPGHPRGADPQGAPSSAVAERVKALEAILAARGYVDPDALGIPIEGHEAEVGPRRGAHVVAHAWRDPDFMAWLTADATAAVASLGYDGRESEALRAVANGPGVHNLVVGIPDADYPWSLLGLPPAWYKSASLRSRAVMEPHAALREFGVVLPDDTEIRVWDSTPERRYLVIPQRPDGTKGWSEMALAQLVTRDSMIGTGLAIQPGGL